MGTEYQITEIEHRWIEMSDGVRLSARIWLPEGTGPVPALLEYIPYRKRDLVRVRDERNHPFFASRGYACLRVDMRGSGDSEGHMPDMYAPDELGDARRVIEWIAEQDWCNGKVGMFGTSWGGTASLQAAVAAPSALWAVIANCATIDRFEDDIHWMGGCLLTDSLEWGATLPAILAAPPDAATVGDDWRTLWEDRLRELTFPLEHWIKHKERGTYWRHGSVRFQAEALSVPVLAIGGWSDRYSNSVMRLVRARPDLCHGIVGPWGHHYPDVGEPGPSASFQHIALAWWDHWLKDGPNPEWPSLRVWERSFDPPQDRLPERNGRWISIDPAGDDHQWDLFLSETGLAEMPESAGEFHVPHDPLHGACAGDTGYFGRLGGLPLEQSPDDARSVCFDSQPLEQPQSFAGHAVLNLQLRDLAQGGQLVARICDIAPDGQSNLVTRTVLNLALDDTLDETSASLAEPRAYRVTFPSTAYLFEKGHRIRVCLGTSYWPLVFPSSAAGDLVARYKGARLSMPKPLRTGGASDLPEVKPPSPSSGVEVLSEGPLTRMSKETQTGRIDGWHAPRSKVRYPSIDLAFSSETSMDYEVNTKAGSSYGVEVSVAYEIERKDGTARITSVLRGKQSSGTLEVLGHLRVDWNDETLLSREWNI